MAGTDETPDKPERPRNEVGQFASLVEPPEQPQIVKDHEAMRSEQTAQALALLDKHEKAAGPLEEEAPPGTTPEPKEEPESKEEPEKPDGDDPPTLSNKERESLRRVNGLSDEEVDALPPQVARKMAEKASETRRQLDELHRKNQELSKERAPEIQSDSEEGQTSTPAPADDPDLTALLDPLRDDLGDDAADNIRKAFDLLLKRDRDREREAAKADQEREQRVARVEAERELDSVCQLLSGEVPDLNKPEVRGHPDFREAVRGMAQSGLFSDPKEAVRAAYEHAFGRERAARATADAEAAATLGNQPTKPGRVSKTTPGSGKSYEEKELEMARLLVDRSQGKNDLSRTEALKAVGLS